MPEGERRLAAIMFTDMVGYTALTQSSESQAMEVLQRHNRLLRPFFPKFHGNEVKAIGDSFLVEFDSALDALRCAVEIQSYLHDYNVSSRDEWKIKLRIGIHIGDVIHREGDVFGDAVNIASRMEPIAEPEGICVSRQVYDQVQNKFELPLVSRGEKPLKNVSGQSEVYGVQMPWEARTGPTALDIHRIAILPFVNISPDPGDEYFADGLTEELIDRLCQVRELEVIARTSVMSFKKKDTKAGEIGKELLAGALVEGSVRKVGDKVRVTAQLINANTEGHLWSARYDRNLEDIFAVQSDIAEQVAEALKIQLLPAEKKAIEKKSTENTEAHDLYLKGLFHMYRYSEAELMAAKGYLEQAVERDPRYALAYATMADVYSLLGFFEMMPPAEAFAKADGLARKALSLEESLAEAHVSLSTVLRFKGNFNEALKELENVLEQKPNLASAHINAAYLFSFRRQFDKSIAEVQKALELDPLSSSTMTDAATSYLYGGSVEKAIELFKRALELDPLNSFAQDNLGVCYVRKGMYAAGISEIRKGIRMAGSFSPPSQSDLVYSLAKAGKTDEARGVISELIQFHKTHRIGASSVASAYGAVGDKEKALEWLEVAYGEHSSYLTTIAIDFCFEEMSSDPRFQKFLKKIGLETEPI